MYLAAQSLKHSCHSWHGGGRHGALVPCLLAASDRPLQCWYCQYTSPSEWALGQESGHSRGYWLRVSCRTIGNFIPCASPLHPIWQVGRAALPLLPSGRESFIYHRINKIQCMIFRSSEQFLRFHDLVWFWSLRVGNQAVISLQRKALPRFIQRSGNSSCCQHGSKAICT